MLKMIIFKNSLTVLPVIFLFSTFILMGGCSSPQANIIGDWVQPIPGIPTQQQGISFHPNGKASSINMQTLQYTNWEKHQNTLFLTGKSIGNHQTISFRQSYEIEKLTFDTLILKNKGTRLIYHKEKDTK